LAVLRYSRLQPFPDEAEYPAIRHPVLDELDGPLVAQIVEKATDVRIKNPVHLLPLNAHRQRIQRRMWTASRTKPVGKAFEVDLIDMVEDRNHRLLDESNANQSPVRAAIPL